MMDDLDKYAARVAVRRVVYILVAAAIAFLASIWPESADAQTNRYADCANHALPSATCRTRQEAHYHAAEAAKRMVTSERRYCGFNYENVGARFVDYVVLHVGSECAPNRGSATARRYWDVTDCPAGSTWDDGQKKCVTECATGEWPDPSNPGQCLNQDKCQARNDTSHTAGERTGPSTQWCVAGCKVEFKKGESYGIGIGGKFLWTGAIHYPGGACAGITPVGQDPLPPPTEPETVADKPDPNACTPHETQTVCVKPNGEMCATGAKGGRYCWKPHMTGEKSSGDEIQTKTVGEGPPSIALSNGDTATKQDSTTISTQTKGGQTSQTTINNYTTDSGANAPSSKDGGKDADDDGDKESASGGETCDSPPNVSGDPGEQMIAMQTWRTRCQAEANAQAISDDAASIKAEADALETPLTAGQGWEGGTGSVSINTGLLGGGGGACPPPPTFGLSEAAPFQWPAGFCDALAMIRALLIALAYFSGAALLLGGRRG